MSSLTVDINDGVARLTLQRPEASNAIDLPLAQALGSAMHMLAGRSDVRVILLTGAGRVFCAGGDVAAMAAAADRPALLAELAGTVHDGLVKLSQLRVPVVAAVQGAAAGAGLGLVLAADIVIAGESARFLTAYAQLGLSPDSGVSHLLPQVIGLRRSLELTLTGRVLTAAEALAWGLITEVASDDQLLARAEAIVARLADGPSPALGASRRLLRSGFGTGYAEHLAVEAQTISEVSSSPDARRLIDAFMARRAGQSSPGDK